MVCKREISNTLIEFVKSLKHSSDFGMPEKISTKKEANHFFVGVTLDHIVKTSVAWSSTELVVRKYGGGETNFWKKIKGVKRNELHNFMKSGNGGKALHVYHGKMTDNLQRAAGLILEKYSGDPRKIWQIKKGGKELFREIKN